MFPTLKIGDTTLAPLQRMGNPGFTASPTKVINGQRSQSGRLFTNELYTKYTIKVSGLALDLQEDLRREYERSDPIDLFSIVNRLEVFDADGTNAVFLTSRRLRLDDNNALPVAEHPIGTVVTAVTFTSAAGATQGSFTFITGSTPSAGSQNVGVRYFPIFSGQILEFDSDYTWSEDEETYNLVFEEA